MAEAPKNGTYEPTMSFKQSFIASKPKRIRCYSRGELVDIRNSQSSSCSDQLSPVSSMSFSNSDVESSCDSAFGGELAYKIPASIRRNHLLSSGSTDGGCLMLLDEIPSPPPQMKKQAYSRKQLVQLRDCSNNNKGNNKLTESIPEEIKRQV